VRHLCRTIHHLSISSVRAAYFLVFADGHHAAPAELGFSLDDFGYKDFAATALKVVGDALQAKNASK
jgi:hypothetical protein